MFPLTLWQRVAFQSRMPSPPKKPTLVPNLVEPVGGLKALPASLGLLCHVFTSTDAIFEAGQKKFTSPNFLQVPEIFRHLEAGFASLLQKGDSKPLFRASTLEVHGTNANPQSDCVASTCLFPFKASHPPTKKTKRTESYWASHVSHHVSLSISPLPCPS